MLFISQHNFCFNINIDLFSHRLKKKKRCKAMRGEKEEKSKQGNLQKNKYNHI